MAKVDSAIKNETKNIAIVVLILSALMQAVYLFIHHWNYTVLLGNLLGGGAGILNFFLMGISLQKALDKDAKDASATARLSQTYRNFMLLAILAIAYFVPCFDIIPTIISLFFATIGVYSKVFTMKKDVNNKAQEVAQE
ncbi:MAG: ATP synthase subunit I [Saccharofermentans sp.]|nr:ATP synthase subunit I [Saccharofermentans sp.]